MSAQRLLLLVALVAGSGAGFLGLALLLPRPSSDDRPSLGATSEGIATVRIVCSLLTDDARRAKVVGIDGGASVVADGRTFWLFGDTFLTGDPGFVNAAAAVSDDYYGEDCIYMDFKASEGHATSLFSKTDEETTAWPEGAISIAPGYVEFFFSSMVRDSPSAWHVTAVGVGRFDTKTMSGVRLSTLWGADSEFPDVILGARSPVRVGNDVFVFLYTTGNRHILARVPAAAMASIEAYVYWDGRGFSREQKDAVSLWDVPLSSLPVHNGLSVQYNPHLGQWIAVYADEFRTVRARTAVDLTGPWSDPVVWFDCQQQFGPEWPVCYSAEQHWELASDGGRTVYMTIGSRQPYNVWLVAVTLTGSDGR